MAVHPVPNPSTGRTPTTHSAKNQGPSKPKFPLKKPVHPKAEEVTRAGVVWVAVSAGLVILVLLIIFILQNQERVTVNYLGATGELSLGMALFIAAVTGGLLVAIAGAARILQLRSQRRHPKDDSSGPGTAGGKEH
ncbi:DUF1049 domain-containing protein [Arthrobacter silviterrae]|uniref:DUF1049 domain-containing protein n=2 Tax=Arthrobacter silviterrae TaxID=2026658 RepID=A0ABX0DED5_9MICC|nr:DUF1049 domain-containing protein [Arthrobacter silviterrae]